MKERSSAYFIHTLSSVYSVGAYCINIGTKIDRKTVSEVLRDPRMHLITL